MKKDWIQIRIGKIFKKEIENLARDYQLSVSALMRYVIQKEINLNESIKEMKQKGGKYAK